MPFPMLRAASGVRNYGRCWRIQEQTSRYFRWSGIHTVMGCCKLIAVRLFLLSVTLAVTRKGEGPSGVFANHLFYMVEPGGIEPPTS